MEHVDHADDVQQPIIREATCLLELRAPQIDITMLADIPAETGLGSSDSFAAALLKARYTHCRRLVRPDGRARLGCEIEIDPKEPIAQPDQYTERRSS